MNRLRVVLVGGFLGSGKTTALLRLARMYAQRGKRVGIIANDLSEGLVDTATYQANGLPVEELPGVCFACRFDQLIAAAGRLQDGHQPDVLLAEPAGSCTDIVSRVIQPLKALYADRFQVAPHVTLLDPQRARQALTGEGPAGFSANVTFLYKMQQNEADVVAINKADTLTIAQREELTRLVSANFPKASVHVVSARNGEGFAGLLATLSSADGVGSNPIEAVEGEHSDSASGEASLAWASVSVDLTAVRKFDPDRLLLDLAGEIQRALRGVDAEPGHVKMSLRAGDRFAVANLVASDRAPELSRLCRTRVEQGRLVVNARVEVDPATLRDQLGASLDRVARMHGAVLTNSSIDACVPADQSPGVCAIRS